MRKHNYCLGYRGDGNVAYGKDENGKSRWIELLTSKEARKKAKEGHYQSGIRIYKLVELKK